MRAIFPFPKDASSKKSIGKLKSLGIKEECQLPLLFPRKYNDIRSANIILDFSLLPGLIGEKVYLACALRGNPQVHFDPSDKKKPARTQFQVKDKQGRTISCVVFGPSKELINSMKSLKSFCLFGEIGTWNNNIQLKNVELVESWWVYKIQPTYPGKTKVITPETVLKRMTELTDLYVHKAIDFIRTKFTIKNEHEEKEFIRMLSDGIAAYDNLHSIIKSIHLPGTIEEGEAAQTILKRLAALDIAERLSETTTVINKDSALNISSDVIKKLIAEMGKTPTRDQLLAVRDIVVDIRSDIPMNRLLTGDVGTGKSFPIAIAAAAVARMNQNAIIMMPNEPLAEQMRRDIETWWPDTQPKLVSGNTKGVPDSRILVGTTALNFRLPEDYPVMLLIIDEQQKLSVSQRTSVAKSYTNILEASATPLPRSMALIKFGGLPISILTQAYVEKTIITRLVFNKPVQKRSLFNAAKQAVYDGKQLLVVYPLAEMAEVEDEADNKLSPEEARKQDLKSAEGAFALWEQHFPGRVRFVHGGMKGDEKLQNINSLNNNEADILCCTTVVEVGLNIPKAAFMIIVHPERLGLSTLHQLRGRLVRHGGTGVCALYLPDRVSDKAMNRLKIFERVTDGFELAAADMRLRGVGDINQSSKDEQSGDVDISFLPSQKLSIEDLEWAINSTTNKTQKTH